MTLTDLLPVRIGLRDKPTGKRRQDDAVDLLQCKLIGARLLIKGLRLQLDDQAHEHAETIARIEARHGETVRGLEAQVARLERQLEIGVLAEAAAAQTQEMEIPADLRERFAEGPVVALNQTPMARRSPGHVPGWVKDQQPNPAA